MANYTYGQGYPGVYRPGEPYTPYYPQMPAQQMQMQPPQPQQQPNSGITWIQGGLPAAKQFLVAANTSVALWDAENPIIYLKSADASGIPSIKIIDYTIRHESDQKPDDKNANYATKDDISMLKSKINALSDKIKEMTKNER